MRRSILIILTPSISIFLPTLKSSGRAVECPTYDFATHCRRSETVSIAPRQTILLEGILVACRADLRALIDRLIFVATDVALRRSRRVHRDQHERGRDLASIERFWTRAESTFREWGALAEDDADLVVGGSKDVEVMTQLVVEYLRHNADHESLHDQGAGLFKRKVQRPHCSRCLATQSKCRASVSSPLSAASVLN